MADSPTPSEATRPASRAYYCEVCDGEATWVITRRGDVATSWSCEAHLHPVVAGLARRGELTECVVKRSVFGLAIEVDAVLRGDTP